MTGWPRLVNLNAVILQALCDLPDVGQTYFGISAPLIRWPRVIAIGTEILKQV